MSSNNAANSGQTPLYKIGAVSRLTGLPSNTIRTWERRYQVVQPERTPSGGRVCSDKDVVRRQLIAVLLDLDNPSAPSPDLAKMSCDSASNVINR